MEQEMHFIRCDMNYALDLLRKGSKEERIKEEIQGKYLERIIMMII